MAAPDVTPEGPPANWICLTPTRNENWIIRHFLAAASRWADRIIVADQRSDDGTPDVARAADKVDLVLNPSSTYDEAHRQRLLIAQARKYPGKRILIALDADEALSADCRDTEDWRKIESAQPGTILRFRWVNVLPDFTQAWVPPNLIPCGFVDDGSDHAGDKIHSTRIPTPPNAPVLDLPNIVVLHFQYIAWDRVVSKHRWYQAWEHIAFPERSALDIFRSYNHMHGSWKPAELFPVSPSWIDGYTAHGINYRQVKAEAVTWWDREIVRMLLEHGTGHFRKFAIWDRDWTTVASMIGTPAKLTDPRTAWERACHRGLAASQSRRHLLHIRLFERLLRSAGW